MVVAAMTIVTEAKMRRGAGWTGTETTDSDLQQVEESELSVIQLGRSLRPWMIPA